MVVKSHLIVSQIHQVKNPMQNFVEGFSSLVVEGISKELHGLNLAPIEPQVFIKNSFACEGFDGTRMALLDASAFAMSPSICLPNDCFLGAPFWPDHFPMCVCVCAFISLHLFPHNDFLAGFLAGSFSDAFHLSQRCLLGWMPALPGCKNFVSHTVFRCWMQIIFQQV